MFAVTGIGAAGKIEQRIEPEFAGAGKLVLGLDFQPAGRAETIQSSRVADPVALAPAVLVPRPAWSALLMHTPMLHLGLSLA